LLIKREDLSDAKSQEKKHRLNVYVRDNLKNLSSRDKSCIRNFF